MKDHRGRPVVAVTGYGMVSSLGQGVADSWKGLTAGRSGIKQISRFPTDKMRTTIAGAIDYLWQDDDTAMDITMRAGILAAEEAIADAAIGTPGDFPGPLFAALPPAEMEWPYRRRLHDNAPAEGRDAYDRMIAAARRENDDYGFRHSLLGFIAEGIHEKIGTKGAPISLTTACASGATAIQLGVEAIRRGETEAAISIGADCSVNPEMMIRFGLLSALSGTNEPPEQVSRPFAKDRDGFVIAEGAAALVLENYDHAVARGAKIHGIIRGIAEKADDFHRTRSKPDGSAIIGAIRNTIEDSGLAPDAIGYVNAHGTSTPENDKMEAMSLEAVFGERMRQVPISSNKSMIGHTLTAAGAIEAIFSIKTIEEGILPPTINYNLPDPAIPFDVVPNVAREAKVDAVLSNSFGFGGQNACLVITGEPA
ncbi:MAG TPA: beta-ketoacyl-ACP synthase [Bauldia sp.]|nr:beta-ketoacyl-ACP synthase [Bauldia sp.]